MKTSFAFLTRLALSLTVAPGLMGLAFANTNVNNMVALRKTSSACRNVTLLGYYAPNDGGGGTFTWVSNSGLPDDCGTVIPTTYGGTPAGRWVRQWSGAANIKWWGAIGDGKSHLLSDAINAHAIPSLAVVQAVAPAVRGTNWDSDAVAVELAKAKVPVNGTCYLPAGTYVCSFQTWNFGGRSHITWNGAGPTATKFYATYDTLNMGALNVGALFAPYDMAGWNMTAQQVYPQTDALVVGRNTITIKPGVSSAGLNVGDVVFWQDGRSNYQQNFGEFNQVTAIGTTTASGTPVTFRYPWNRDYTTHVCEYGGRVVGGPYAAPPVNGNISLPVNYGVGPTPSLGDAVSLGNDVYTYLGQSSTPGYSIFQNAGRGNTMSVIQNGTTVSGVCALVRCTQATTDIAMTNLGIVGCWDAIQIANTINLSFTNCAITMQRMADTPAGGLFFDGDGGREIDFNNCTFTAPLAWASQWGRSTSGIRYNGCTFNNVEMSYSEYVNDCDLTNSTLTIDGSNPVGPRCAIAVGTSCGGIRITGCNINASNMPEGVFENSDIQGFVYFHGSPVNISNNTINSTSCSAVFAKTYGFGQRPTTISGNTITGTFCALGWLGQVPDPNHFTLDSPLVQVTGNTISAHFDYLLTSAGGCDNLMFENNVITKLGAYQGWPGGSILWDAGAGPNAAKQQLWILNNTFTNWTFPSTANGLFNLYNPWGSGIQISNKFLNTTSGPRVNFNMALTGTLTYTTSAIAGLP